MFSVLIAFECMSKSLGLYRLFYYNQPITLVKYRPKKHVALLGFVWFAHYFIQTRILCINQKGKNNKDAA